MCIDQTQYCNCVCACVYEKGEGKSETGKYDVYVCIFMFAYDSDI